MYQLILSNKSSRFLDKIYNSDRSLYRQFIIALDTISDTPYLGKALVGNLKGYWSYRVRDYRILYEIEKERLIVYVERIAHRKESY